MASSRRATLMHSSCSAGYGRVKRTGARTAMAREPTASFVRIIESPMKRVYRWGWLVLAGCATSGGPETSTRPLAVASCDHALGCEEPAPTPLPVTSREPTPKPVAHPAPTRAAAEVSLGSATGPTVSLDAGWTSIDPATGHAELTELRRRLSSNLGEDQRALQHQMARLHLAIATHPETPVAEATVQRNDARRILESRLDDQTDPARAELLISLAWLQSQDGDDQGMKKALVLLIRDQPTSPAVPLAYLLLGDAMAADNPDAAARIYEKAAQFPEVTAYASYRRAWAALAGEDDGRSALDHFVRAIKAAQSSPAAKGDPPVGVLRMPPAHLLVSAARRELVVAYAKVGNPRKAWAFFDRIGRDPDHGDLRTEMMLGLAAAYRTNGQTDEAAVVCAELAARAPGAASRCPP